MYYIQNELIRIKYAYVTKTYLKINTTLNPITLRIYPKIAPLTKTL